MLEEDKQREAARQIERVSSELLGDNHFAYGPEANKLACVDVKAWLEFADRVVKIRNSLDEQYRLASEKLSEGEENENT